MKKSFTPISCRFSKLGMVAIFLLFTAGVFAQIPMNGSIYRFTNFGTSAGASTFTYVGFGVYTPIIGGTTLGTASNNEEIWNGSSVAPVPSNVGAVGFPLGFSLSFNGGTYTHFSVNTNGWVRLQTSANTINFSTASPLNPGFVVGSKATNALAALARDLSGNGLTSSLKFLSSPTELIVEWQNYKDGSTIGDDYSFQISIQSSGIIEYRYGNFIKNTTNQLVQVGIRGSNLNSAAQYHIRTVPVGGDWATSTMATAASALVALQIPPPVVPINDLCENAILLTCPALVTGNTSNATNDFQLQCGAGTGVQEARGVWYKYVGTNSNVTLSLCGSGYDTRISVFEGTCGNLVCYAGNDDSGAGLCGTQSQVTFGAFSGVTYHILVHGLSAIHAGTYTLTLSCNSACSPPHPYDNCQNPMPLNVAFNTVFISGNNQCSTVSPNANPGCGGIFSQLTDVWHSFSSGISSTMVFDLSTVGAPNPVITGPYYYALYHNCGTYSGFCGDLVVNSPEVINLEPNTFYLLRLYTSSQDGNIATYGNYNILLAPPVVPPTGEPPVITPGTIASCYSSSLQAETAALLATSALPVDCPGLITYAASTTGTCSATVTVTATDNCGNSSSVNYSTRIDNVGPVLNNCPANTTYACYSQIPPAENVTATDDCDGTVNVVFSESQSNGNSNCSNSIIRTWVATDACGNSTSCEQVIVINNSNGPVFDGCPASTLNVQCMLDVPVAPTITATDDCDGGVNVSFAQVSSNGSSNCNNVVTRTWTATDACGNTSTCSQTIIVNDTDSPVISCPPSISTCNATIELGTPTVSDACGAVTITNNAPLVFPMGTTMVTWTATDACGNSTTCQQTITRFNPMSVTIAPVPVLSQLRSCGWGFTTHIVTGLSTAQSVVLYPTITGGTPPFTYSWSGSNLSRLSNTSIKNPTYTPTINGMACYEDCYYLTVTDATGNCTITSSSSVCIRVQIGGAGSNGDASCQNNPQKVMVCHMPPGNPTNIQNICISIHGVPAHSFGPDVGPTSLSHKFDCIGSCDQLPCGIAPKNNIAAADLLQDDLSSGSILENYPDPFKEITTIRFVLEQSTHVKMEIYDLTGKLVQKAFDGNVAAQEEVKVEINGTELNSGLYIYKLITPSEVSTGKMMLLKD